MKKICFLLLSISIIPVLAVAQIDSSKLDKPLGASLQLVQVRVVKFVFTAHSYMFCLAFNNKCKFNTSYKLAPGSVSSLLQHHPSSLIALIL